MRKFLYYGLYVLILFVLVAFKSKPFINTNNFRVITQGGKQLQSDSVPGLEWDKLEYNFGKITAGEKVETVFHVTNNRKDTMEIENVAGSCGCLVPKWTKGRILPGGKGEVTVRFNSEGKWGKQTRSVAVYTSKGLFTLYLYALIDEN